MANYGGFGRTNYFRVKDANAFEAAAEPFGAVHRRDEGLVTVLATNETGDFSACDDETDEEHDLAGILPDLFVEGSGVVAEGRLANDGTFVADNLLAKHDENYVPRELQDMTEHQAREVVAGAETVNANRVMNNQNAPR